MGALSSGVAVLMTNSAGQGEENAGADRFAGLKYNTL